ncbi:MAG TPA: hypothetical protein VGQ62_24045 [Chloroflexota bacterium]|jgi:hypothetical protein|nr:hypothetical protein [Chloroflexota bacterium]
MDAANIVNPAARAIINAHAFDEPCRFGRRPTTQAAFPFTDRQFAAPQIMRGRVNAASLVSDQAA